MIKDYKIEACVETYQEALQAQINGADQIELCGRLDLDGITPSNELIQKCVEHLKLDIKVMIRPRGGSFDHTLEEIELMKTQIAYCKEMNVHGVVFGILKNKSLDLNLIEVLAKLAAPLNVTIHKAIDTTDDILLETHKLISIHQHIDTILTSGGQETAEQGKSMLRQMIAEADGKINIMPAGKITNLNLQKLHEELNTTGYHGRKIVGDLTRA